MGEARSVGKSKGQSSFPYCFGCAGAPVGLKIQGCPKENPGVNIAVIGWCHSLKINFTGGMRQGVCANHEGQVGSKTDFRLWMGMRRVCAGAKKFQAPSAAWSAGRSVATKRFELLHFYCFGYALEVCAVYVYGK